VTSAGVVPSLRTLEGELFAGFLRAERELPIQGRVIYVSPTQDPAGVLASLARQKYDLVIVGAPGGLLDIVYPVARKFQDVPFFVIDVPPQWPKHRPANVWGSIYRAEEAGYLAGYLAALMENRTPGKHVISAVGGYRFQGVDRWLVGYEAGAKKADAALTVRTAYSDNFTNPTKCRRVALRQIAQGSAVVFNVAGSCGLGALRAAKDEGVWGIGVDVNQSFLGPHILTNAVLKLDKGVFTVIQTFLRRRSQVTGDSVFSLRNGGVGLVGTSAKVPPRILRRVEGMRRAIIAGKIRVPRAT
jgi:basic membrane protein A